MRHALEPLPLLVAAILGGAALSALDCFVLKSGDPPGQVAFKGAVVGLIVQLGVRLTGIS